MLLPDMVTLWAFISPSEEGISRVSREVPHRLCLGSVLLLGFFDVFL